MCKVWESILPGTEQQKKKLVIKHAKEAAINVLQLNNSKVDGLDKENHVFLYFLKQARKSLQPVKVLLEKNLLKIKI